MANKNNFSFSNCFRLYRGLTLIHRPEDKDFSGFRFREAHKVCNISRGQEDPARARFVSEHTPPPVPAWQDNALVEKWKSKLHHNS